MAFNVCKKQRGRDVENCQEEGERKGVMKDEMESERKRGRAGEKWRDKARRGKTEINN